MANLYLRRRCCFWQLLRCRRWSASPPPHSTDSVDAADISANNDDIITIYPEGKINDVGELELTKDWIVEKDFEFPRDVIFEDESKRPEGFDRMKTSGKNVTISSGKKFTITDYDDATRIEVSNNSTFTNGGIIKNYSQIKVTEGGTFDSTVGEYYDCNDEMAPTYSDIGLHLEKCNAKISNGSDVCVAIYGGSISIENSSVSMIFVNDCTEANISNCHTGNGIHVDYYGDDGFEHGSAYIFGGNNINFSDCSLNDLVIKAAEVKAKRSLSIAGALFIGDEGGKIGKLYVEGCYMAHTGYIAVSKGAEKSGGTSFSPGSISVGKNSEITLSSDPSDTYIDMWKKVRSDVKVIDIENYDGDEQAENGSHVIVNEIPESWDKKVKFSIDGFDKPAYIEFTNEAHPTSAVISILMEKTDDGDEWTVKVIGTDLGEFTLSLPYDGDIEITDCVGMEYYDDKNVFVLNNAVASCIISSSSPGPTPGPEPKPEPIVIITYSVSYDVNGGSEPIPGTVRYEEGTMAEVAPYTGYKDGYIFGGWSSNGKTYRAGDVFTVNGDMKLTAVWNAVPGPEPTPSGDNNTGLIIGIVVAVVAAIAVIGGVAYYVRKK